MRGRILLIERNADIAASVAAVLKLNHFDITRTDSDDDAIRLLVSGASFDVLVVDVNVGSEAAGLTLLRHVQANAPHLIPRIIVISGHPTADVRRELDAIGVCDIVPKPVDADEIVKAVEECLDRMTATVQ